MINCDQYPLIRYKFLIILLIITATSCFSLQGFSQTGCRIAYDNGVSDNVIYTTKINRTVQCNGYVVDVYSLNAGGPVSPANCPFTPNLNPSPASFFRNCVVMYNPTTDSNGFCGIVSNYSLSCPLDDYTLLLFFPVLVSIILLLRRNTRYTLTVFS